MTRKIGRGLPIEFTRALGPPIRRAVVLSCMASMLSSTTSAQTVVHVLDGSEEGDRFGEAVTSVGDIDGDGVADFAVGTKREDGDHPGAGSVRVYSGFSGRVLHAFFGEGPLYGLGYSVAGAGDVNGDGVPDVMASLQVDPNGGWTGRVRVYSGSDGRILHEFQGDAPNDAFGGSIASAGDVDGDGRADVIVGAGGADTPIMNAGRVRVFSGSNGTILLEFLGTEMYEGLGMSVCGIGDLSGDGVPDLAVGSPRHDSGFVADTGRVWIFSGADGAVLRTFDGWTAGANLGRALAAAGDVNRDGYPDVLVGAPHDGSFTWYGGNARVHSGRDGTILHEWFGFDLLERVGERVAGLGDVNGDGFPDLGVASGTESVGQTPVIHVYSGLDFSSIFVLGPRDGDWTWPRIAGPGDVNGDGYADLLIGAQMADSNGVDSGSVFVLSGHEHLVPYCFGDGGGAPCPCINEGGPGEGCANSGGAGGLLAASGSASLVDDELAFAAAQLLPGQPALLFAGANAVNGGLGQPFGDGLRCAGGGVQRLGIRVPDGAGHASFGPGLSAAGGWSAGDAARFQAWYRDPVSPCDSNFNLTNGLEVIFSL